MAINPNKHSLSWYYVKNIVRLLKRTKNLKNHEFVLIKNNKTIFFFIKILSNYYSVLINMWKYSNVGSVQG